MIAWDGEPAETWPSAEDEYLASLEPEIDYTAELILALSDLTPKQRFVIECHYGLRGDELGVCEIAVLMGVSHQAVVRLIQRGMENLRRGLRKSPIDAESIEPHKASDPA